ncbi:MAG: hypothetical protein G3I10_10900 [Ferrovum sp.]|nr:hypothetical protein [Ferrovum sp.]
MADEKKSGEIFEMFQKMINPMAFPMQNLMMAGLSVEEIDKKISELTTVKHWLNTNVGMLELTIKTLEYQRALLKPAQGSEPGKPSAAPPQDNPMLNPALWPWAFMGVEKNVKPPSEKPASGKKQSAPKS